MGRVGDNRRVAATASRARSIPSDSRRHINSNEHSPKSVGPVFRESGVCAESAGAVQEAPEGSGNSQPCCHSLTRPKMRFLSTRSLPIRCFLAFGLPSTSVLLGEFVAPRLRESQSLTQSGTVAGANATERSARIHMSASACLQGNFLLGHVHLYPASASLITTRYGVAPEPCHSPQASLSPTAKVGQLDGFSNFRAAASDAWS